MVVLGGDSGVGSGGLGGWLCTRRGELEIGPDFDPPAAPEGPCRPPKSIIFHCFPYVSPSLNLAYFSTLQGRVSTVVLLAPNTLNNLLTKQNLTNPLLPWWSLGVTQGWVRGVSEAACARVGMN